MDTRKIYSVVVLAAFALTACNGTGRNTEGNGLKPLPQGFDGGVIERTLSVRNSDETTPAGLGGHAIERTLDLKNFDGITSSLHVDVHYTQGDRYKGRHAAPSQRLPTPTFR